MEAIMNLSAQIMGLEEHELIQETSHYQKKTSSSSARVLQHKQTVNNIRKLNCGNEVRFLDLNHSLMQ